ncbi:hypothetical protein GK047_10615 [Paenibacillus sp. SYP-B3998]|uniref:Uncharacterized protein n=1 Tax=Paenibacillus sp. SYP-B3998 TaxID=2678564 RepID=A0A6G3ZWF4_9BACL|nr:hypothetical protein [Paenibacillus sp. SYP-B3998]NEW06462.1 hypothetical protein [Paenibacillus sp. SYP-B3998]
MLIGLLAFALVIVVIRSIIRKVNRDKESRPVIKLFTPITFYMYFPVSFLCCAWAFYQAGEENEGAAGYGILPGSFFIVGPLGSVIISTIIIYSIDRIKYKYKNETKELLKNLRENQ